MNMRHLNITYRRRDNKVFVHDVNGKLVREIQCESVHVMIQVMAIMQDFYELGYNQCVEEVEQANQILGKYNITGIKVPKNDK